MLEDDAAFRPGPVDGGIVDQNPPADGCNSPAAMFIAVDLPQPDGPTTVMNSPSAMSSVRWSSASEPSPKRADTSWNEIFGVMHAPARP